MKGGRATASMRDASRLGAMCAALICALVAALGFLMNPPTGWLLGIAGLPASTFVAWRLAPSVVTAGRWSALGLASLMAAATYVLSDLVISIGIVVWAMISAVLSALVHPGQPSLPGFAELLVAIVPGVIFLFVVGAAIFATTAIPTVLVAALVWVVAVRLIGDRRFHRGTTALPIDAGRP
jgi:hypothetical protein